MAMVRLPRALLIQNTSLALNIIAYFLFRTMVAEARKVIEGHDTKLFNTRAPKRRYLATEKDKLVSLRCIRSRSPGAQIMDLRTGESCEVKTNYVFQSTQFIVGGKHTTKTKQLYLL